MSIDNTKVPKTLYPAGHDVFNSDLENERDNMIVETLYRVITSNGRFGVIDYKLKGTKLVVTDAGSSQIGISAGIALDGWGKRTALLSSYTRSVTSGDNGKYVCIKAVTVESDARAHPVTGVNSYTRETIDTDGDNIIFLLSSIPVGQENDYIILDKIITVAAGVVTLASVSMTDAEFAAVRKVFSAQSVWWNRVGPSGVAISPSVSEGCTLEEFLACKGSGARSLTNPLGLTLDDIGSSIVTNHLRGSHRTGIRPASEIDREALRPYISGANIALTALKTGEYLQIDNQIWLPADISSYVISFAAGDYGNNWTIYFDKSDPYPKKILKSSESTLVNGELLVCWVTVDSIGNFTAVVDHNTGSGGPYRYESFFSTRAKDIGLARNILKWFIVGSQESGYIYDTDTTYDNSIFLNKGIILIPASGATPQVRTISAVTDGPGAPEGAHESYGLSSAFSPAATVGDLVGVFELGTLGYDDVQHAIDKTWARFHSSTGHGHTGTLDDAPQILAGGISAGAVTDVKIGNRTVDDAIPSAYANTGALTTILSWFAKRFKEVLGTTNWLDSVPASLTTLWAKFAATAGAGGHTHSGVAGDGPVLTPPPSVGFSAFRYASFNYTGPGITSLGCDTESFDDGSGYDTSNKWYIVPSDGIYLFTVVAVINFAGTTWNATTYLRIDGSTVYPLQGLTQSIPNGSKLLKLTAGQKVEAMVGGYQIQIYGAADGTGTCFMGHRVA